MKKLLLVAALLVGLSGVTQAQVLMPGPSATLLSAVGATTTSSAFPIAGYGITTFQLVTAAAATGTINVQASLDNTNWTALQCWLAGTTTASTGVSVTGATANSLLMCNTDGVPVVRVVLSPYLGGTWTANAAVSAGPRAK